MLPDATVMTRSMATPLDWTAMRGNRSSSAPLSGPRPPKLLWLGAPNVAQEPKKSRVVTEAQRTNDGGAEHIAVVTFIMHTRMACGQALIRSKQRCRRARRRSGIHNTTRK